MKTLVSRTAFAALLATSIGAGFVALTPAAALAQMSPGNPNYRYDGRGGNGIYATTTGTAAYSRFQNGLEAQASASADRTYSAQDPDPNVRLQLRKDYGIFDR